MSIGAIIAIVLGIVRLVESIFQWYNQEDTKGVIAALIAILKNFFLKVETYKGGK